MTVPEVSLWVNKSQSGSTNHKKVVVRSLRVRIVTELTKAPNFAQR